MPRIKVKQVDGALAKEASHETIDLSADEPHLQPSADIVHITQTGGPWSIQGVDDANIDTFAVHNDSASELTIAHESTSANSASERINCPEGANIVLPPDGWVQLVRHPGDNRWNVPDRESQHARGLRETGGPTLMSMGAVPDNTLLRRNGAVAEGSQTTEDDAGNVTVAGNIDAGGNTLRNLALRTLVGSGSLALTDSRLLVDTSGGAVNLALPTPSVSMEFVIKKTTADTNTITLTRAGTETIEGTAADHTLGGSDSGDREAWALVYDNANDAWWVI